MMARAYWMKRWSLLAALMWVSATINTAVAEEAAQQEFQRGYFLQTHEHDLAGATTAFETVVADADAPAELRAMAKARLGQCREELAAGDFKTAKGKADSPNMTITQAVADWREINSGRLNPQMAFMSGKIKRVRW